MPRSARQKCESGIYHIITRGISRQLLFEEDGDFLYYLNKMDACASDTHVTVFAYALMSNHVHLLVRDPEDQLDRFMKKLGVSYAQYFNTKYQRVGHLFQDRYKSEPVRDDRYFLTVYRYILRNPEKAGIAPADRYKWSSYHDYFAAPVHSRPEPLREMIGDKEMFLEFMKAEDDRICMEYDPIKKDDAAALRLIQRMLPADRPIGKDERNRVLRELKAQGLTVRQIERLTGIGRGIIQRV